MENEIRIPIPEGMEIDRENSTFECIKFKPIVKRWRDNKNVRLKKGIISMEVALRFVIVIATLIFLIIITYLLQRNKPGQHLLWQELAK